MAVDQERAANAVKELLTALGEDPERPGLRETPTRMAQTYAELLSGMDQDPKDLFATVFDLGHEELVIVKDIEVQSLCEHHLLPFTGKAHIGYIPGTNGKVAGLSQLARLVDLYAKRLQLQERLTTQIATAVLEYLNPSGVIVVLSCEHHCMTMRGIKKSGSKTITSAVRGALKQANTRAEAMRLILHS